MVAALDAGEAEADEAGEEGDGEGTGEGRWKREEGRWKRGESGGSGLEAVGSFQQGIEGQSFGVLGEGGEELVFSGAVSVGFALQTGFLSPDGEVYGRGNDVLVCHADVSGLPSVLEGEDGTLGGGGDGADDNGAEASAVRFCGYVQGLELDGGFGGAVFAGGGVHHEDLFL